ncbi:hypothetical protein [Marinobacter salarius]|uniref:hypothetical protein n=1 Tax=Marinobacter salarius TaxID=1420917 RepID=UPI001C6FC89D|nr:hypothetical protein [Marinobacter salarius]
MGVNLDVGFHRESFPEQIKKISIHRGGGGLANFVVLANSKLTGFTAVSYFFTLTRDEPFFCPFPNPSDGLELQKVARERIRLG